MRKLTEKQIDERIISKIIKRIKNFEKTNSQQYVHSACYRYIQSNLAKRKAQKDLQDAEKRLADAKRRLQ